jgi:hypothetical protein
MDESAQQSTRKLNSKCSDVKPTKKGNQQHGIFRRGAQERWEAKYTHRAGGASVGTAMDFLANHC